MSEARYTVDRADDRQPGTWHPANGGIYATCPDCGCYINLSSHKVAANGEVTPAAQCAQRGCGFNELIQLDRWGT